MAVAVLLLLHRETATAIIFFFPPQRYIFVFGVEEKAALPRLPL
jgi:hypothetical protein